MSQAIEEERLLQAIEKDDIKAFDALMEEAQCGTFRLGRFPVLSLLYLYNCRKIISAYEEKFLKIPSWKELREPPSIAKRFSEKAGKCLRLYLSEVVSPLEMLLILDKTKRLKKVYPQARPSGAVKARLQSVYSIKYSLNIKFEGNAIVIDRRPLSYTEKKRIGTACICFGLAAAIIIAAPTTGVLLFGKRAGGDVTRLSHIDFAADTTYTLKKDIVIPENYSVESVNCTIIGNGNKLIFGKNATLGRLNANMSDLEIQTSGSPVFTVCMPNTLLTDITVTVDADVVTNNNTALLTAENYGTLDGVTMNVCGNLSAVEGEEEELVFGGLVMLNANTVKNCTVNYSGLTLEGEVTANATFGGIVGVNYGIVQDCTVTGEIVADTFDLAGACYVNYNELSEIVNEANLSLTSADMWYPVIGGIVINNVDTVSYCKNTGDIVIDGQNEATCGGIAARAYQNIVYCVSSGNITVSAPTACIGGIFGLGGVATDGKGTYYYGQADHCIAEGKIALQSEGTSFIGGIGGYIPDFPVDQSNSTYMGYSVLNCIFMGEVQCDFNYFGNIVGVCGENIYKANSYISDNKQYHYFDGNYYLKNGLPSFGATTAGEDGFALVEGKGATSATEAEIKDTELYQKILEALGM